MYQSVLVPLDGSPFGESALPAAVAIARRTRARLHVVHVRGATTTGTGLPGLAAGWGPEAERAARTYLDDVARRVASDLGEQAAFALLDGAIAEAVCDYADAQAVSIIVMSTHGRRGLSRAWLGSVAAGVVRKASAPVLLVRPRKGGARPGSTLRVRHMLIPLDGSSSSQAIVAPAAALGKLTGARITLVSVIEPVFRLGEAVLVPAIDYDEKHHHEAAAAGQANLDRVAVSLRSRGFEVETRLQSGEAVEMILETAKETGADLIALATHGRGGWQRLAFGSVADKLVRTSALPFLVFRPEDEESSEPT